MANLVDTSVNGDLRVTGTMFGTQAGNYATCATAAGTAAKAATISGFTLTTGIHVFVKFTVTNTAAVASLTLNVSGTGAKAMKYRGGNLPAVGTLSASRVYEFIYDGTNWELVGDLDTNTQTVTGVKGNAESSYRTGQVNLTAANIGASASDHSHGNIANGGTLTDTAAAAAGNDYVVIRDADNAKIQTSTIKGTDVADAVSKKHSHSTLTLSTTAQAYDGTHTLALPSSDPYTSARTPASHTHGNIANGGTLSDTAAAAAGNDYVVIRDADNSKIQTSTIKGTDVADAVSKKHSHSTLTLSTTAQKYDGSHTLALPSTDPYTSARTPASHTHGNIQNGGTLQTNDVTIASGDKLVITDSSDSNKVARASISFDGSTTSKALTPKGTFETFLTSHQSLSGYVPTSRTINSKALTGNISLTASDVGAATSGHTHSVMINGSTKTIAASGGTAVDLGRYLTKTDLTSPSVSGGIWFLIGETTIASWTNYDEVALISSRHLGTGMLVLSARHNSNTISLNSLGCSITIYGNSDADGKPLSGWYRFYAKQNESNISLRLYAYTTDYSGLNANHIAGSLTLFTTKTIATSDLITTETDFNTAISGWTLKATVKYCIITDTTYTSKSAASGGTDVSLVTTGEKYTWNAKSTLALGETSSTAYRGDRGKTAYDHSQATHAPTTSSAAASGGTTLSLVTTGEKYTWNNKSNLAIGTTASTAAAGNHTHTTSIVSDSSSGTVVSLARNTQYKLTAGGTSVLFKTPADSNTDTKVTQTADNTSDGTGFEVLFSATGDNTTRTEGSRKSNKLTFQPSTGTLTATKFSGALTGNVTGNCSGSSGSCTGNAATATKATQDSEGYGIKANYMRTTSGNKILSFGGTTTIGKTNGSDVKLVMPEANADVFEVSANSTSFSDVLAAYNAHKKLILQIGFNMPGTLTAIYNIPLNRIVYSDDTPVIFVWVYTQDSLTGDTNRGVITTWSLGSTGWASDEEYTYYSDTAGLSEKASALIDFGDTSRMTRVGWGGSSIGKVIASGSSSSLSESSYLAGYYVADGMGHVKDVKAANVTVGDSIKWNGWSIVVGSTGSDANTIYFV